MAFQAEFSPVVVVGVVAGAGLKTAAPVSEGTPVAAEAVVATISTATQAGVVAGHTQRFEGLGSAEAGLLGG